MGAKYTDSQKQATIKYLQEKTDDIRIRVPKGVKDVWRSAAQLRNMSLTQFVVSAVEKEIASLK